jgi:hypothetical protein
MSNVSSSGGSEGVPYKPQYTVSPEFRQFWEKLFHGAALTNKEVSQLTDQFTKNVWSQMNQVLQWALQQQKKRDQKEKES